MAGATRIAAARTPGTTTAASSSGDGSDEKQFQATQLINLVDFATRFKWSPWRDTQPRVTTEEADDSTDMTQLRRWRLKCDLMRVATYYRVTGAQMRVDARKRSARTRTRFREWAASVRRERAAAARPSAETEGGNGQRASRKRPMQTGSYSEARTYKQRATQEEMSQRRLRPRRRRHGPTANSTEIGKRQRDEMSEIARECAKYRRRERFGDG